MKKKQFPCPFGQVLVHARMSRGMTQYRLAKMMGRSVQQLSKIERGEREPMLSTLLMLARALGVGPDELVLEAAKVMPTSEAETTEESTRN